MELSRLSALYEEADALLLSRDFATAAEKYSAVIVEFGDTEKARLNRASCHLQTSKFADCLRDVEEVLRRPQSGFREKAARLQLQCCAKMGDFSASEATLRDAAALSGAFGHWARKQQRLIAKVQTLSREVRQFEKIRSEALSAAEWTLIPKLWLDKWRDYTGRRVQQRPPPIDMTEYQERLSPEEYFTDPHSRFRHMNVAVRAEAQEGLDFLLVPLPAFEFLSATYGQKGEVLRRNAVNGEVELRYRRVKADCFGLGGSALRPKWLILSKVDTVTSLKDKLTRCLKQTYLMANVVETASQLWKLSKSDFELIKDKTMLPAFLKTSTVLDASSRVELTSEEMLLIEYQRKDGEWLLKSAPKDLCVQCHTPGAANLCGGCRAVRYCSKECQNVHFKVHKELCKKHRTDTKKTAIAREGLCGLQNIGNTCFMNSALQCISHVLPLTQYFLQGTYLADINKSNVLGSGGNLARAYANLLKFLWEGSEGYVAPTEFRRILGKTAPQFCNFMQQDAHELLSFVLDGLHEDLNRVVKKPQTSAVEGNGTDDARVAAESWENHLKRNRSVLVDLMHGQCKSTLICPQCDRVSITFDPFMTHTLQLSQFEVRPVTVYFVPLRSAAPVKVCFRLRGTCSIQSLKDLLLPYTSASNLQIWTIVGRKLQRCLVDSQMLEDTRGQAIMAFECDPGTDAGIPVLQTRGPEEVISWSRLIFARDTDTKEDLERKVGAALAYPLSLMGTGKAAYQLLVVKAKGCAVCSVKTCQGCALASTEETTLGQLRAKAGKFLLEVRWSRACRELRFLDSCEGSDSARVAETAVSPSLDELLRMSSSPEILDADNMWYCNRCKEHVQALKQYEFYKTPNILIIHLKRFKPRLLEKLSIKVDFPISGLEVKTLSSPEGETYDLIAVTNHIGAAFAGHYTAFVRNQRGGGWFEMDDHRVLPAKERDVVTPYAYLLFYAKRYQED